MSHIHIIVRFNANREATTIMSSHAMGFVCFSMVDLEYRFMSLDVVH